MNEKKAKKLRKAVFGDLSFKGAREYLALYFDKKEKLTELTAETILRYVPFTVILKPNTPHSNYRIMKRALARRGA